MSKKALAKKPTTNQVIQAVLQNPSLVMNAMTSRADLLQKLFDPRRDINHECGYPDTINDIQYKAMYDREMGRRVVSVYPEETWKRLPKIYEDENPETTTEFEKSLDALDKRHNLLHFLQRIDELSGIGQYGIILWGVGDGKKLNEPVDGWEKWEEVTGEPRTGKPPKGRLLFIRVFDASLVKISGYEEDVTNPRYGMPTTYTITLADPRNSESGSPASQPNTTETQVHWTRVSHIADNRTTSEVLGTPRMQAVWNRLYDLRKILGGNGEMFWRGGFPGISLETQPGLENAELDEEATRTMMFNYMNSLQRYLALTGMTAKSLAPQVADPLSSFETQMKALGVIMGIPYRVLMGIEEGVVSGDQATKAWAGRLHNRQTRYVTPMLINPVIQRLIDYGILMPTKEPQGWTVEWPDLTAPDDKDRASVAGVRTDAFSKYVAGGVDTLIPPLEFLTVVCGFEEAEAKMMLKSAIEQITAIQEGTEPTPPRLPTPEPLQDPNNPDNPDSPEDQGTSGESGADQPPPTAPKGKKPVPPQLQKNQRRKKK